MPPSFEATFKQNYQTHLKHLKLKGLQPKTIEAYARAMRRIGAYFEYRLDDLPEPQLSDYFSRHSCSSSFRRGSRRTAANARRSPVLAAGLRCVSCKCGFCGRCRPDNVRGGRNGYVNAALPPVSFKTAVLRPKSALA